MNLKRFFAGHGPVWGLLLTWGSALALALFGWSIRFVLYEKFVVGRGGVPVTISSVEVSGFLAFSITAWLLAPRMETWELMRPVRPRRWGALIVAVVLPGSTALLGVGQVYLALSRLNTWLPLSGDGAAVTELWRIDATIPTLSLLPLLNLAIIGALVFVATGLLGRVPGFFVSLTLWVGLALSTGQSWCASSPYGVCVTAETPPTLTRVSITLAVATTLSVITWVLGGGSPRIGIEYALNHKRKVTDS
ncbi:MAG: hypothetical protein LBC29_07355 [Propionibacteriaceae bacterium]|jgi:hypothetical protein|nr:hypothetical protein [Propionibacteriaceae bacterium]